MNDITIVISCAGMGSRLGLGKTKALLEVAGKPLILHQLELLDDYDDIRIVVGYKADEVIRVVRSYRKDISFLYNYDYQTTGTAASFSKGLIGAREFVVALDGDLLVNPKDFHDFLAYDGEAIGGCIPTTDNPVLMTIKDNDVVKFSRTEGQLEWTGLAKLKSERLVPGLKHVYMMIEPLLPVPVIEIRTKEIDTPNDYKNAVEWVQNGYV